MLEGAGADDEETGLLVEDETGLLEETGTLEDEETGALEEETGAVGVLEAGLDGAPLQVNTLGPVRVFWFWSINAVSKKGINIPGMV